MFSYVPGRTGREEKGEKEMFFDLHCHLLYGVDDGASSLEEMKEMLDLAYADGTRAICATPHFSPPLFGENTEKSRRVFAELREYAAERYPDLYLYLGHELGYYGGCLEALEEKRCRSINGGRYVLVDFPESVSFYELSAGMLRMLRTGYIPILAHTERYRSLSSHLSWVEEFRENGGVVQINASSPSSAGLFYRQQARRLLREGLVDVVSSDGHNTTRRPPRMSVCLDTLSRYCTPEEIRRLTWDNACRIAGDEAIER